jgi:rhodanese-related sulfurtransferase
MDLTRKTARLVPVLALTAASACAFGPRRAPAASATPGPDAMVAAARARIVRIAPADLKARLAGRAPPLLVDVREESEWAAGHLPGAVHIPRGLLEFRVGAAAPDADAPIVVYCASGARAALAAESLGRMGYRRVESLAGGFQAWRAAGLPVTGGEAGR